MLKKLILSVCAIMLCTIYINAQEQINAKQTETGNEKSYEVLLQVLVASNNLTEKNAFPNSLQNVVKKLQTSFPQSTYRVVMTQMSRVAERGNFESKSVSNTFSDESKLTPPVFYEYSLSGTRGSEIEGQKMFQAQSFRFGAKIPILGKSSEANPIFNYEQVGISASRLNLREGVPTIVGTMSDSRFDGLMVIVLTIKDDSSAK